MVDMTAGGMQKGLDWAVTIRAETEIYQTLEGKLEPEILRISLATCWSDTRLEKTLISSDLRSVCSLDSM